MGDSEEPRVPKKRRSQKARIIRTNADGLSNAEITASVNRVLEEAGDISEDLRFVDAAARETLRRVEW